MIKNTPSESTTTSGPLDKTLPPITAAFAKSIHKQPSFSTAPDTVVTPLPILPRPQLPSQSMRRSSKEGAPNKNVYSSSVYYGRQEPDIAVRRASDPSSTGTAHTITTFHTSLGMKRPTMMTSEEILAEKRRRNAGASARFRDRRKQKEKDLSDRCQFLEQRNKALEAALRLLNPHHTLLLQTTHSLPSTASSSTAVGKDSYIDNVENDKRLLALTGQKCDIEEQSNDNASINSKNTCVGNDSVTVASTDPMDTKPLIVELRIRIERLESIVSQLKSDSNVIKKQ